MHHGVGVEHAHPLGGAFPRVMALVPDDEVRRGADRLPRDQGLDAGHLDGRLEVDGPVRRGGQGADAKPFPGQRGASLVHKFGPVREPGHSLAPGEGASDDLRGRLRLPASRGHDEHDSRVSTPHRSAYGLDGRHLVRPQFAHASPAPARGGGLRPPHKGPSEWAGRGIGRPTHSPGYLRGARLRRHARGRH